MDNTTDTDNAIFRTMVINNTIFTSMDNIIILSNKKPSYFVYVHSVLAGAQSQWWKEEK